jgi:hypothetical protein
MLQQKATPAILVMVYVHSDAEAAAYAVREDVRLQPTTGLPSLLQWGLLVSSTEVQLPTAISRASGPAAVTAIIGGEGSPEDPGTPAAPAPAQLDPSDWLVFHVYPGVDRQRVADIKAAFRVAEAEFGRPCPVHVFLWATGWVDGEEGARGRHRGGSGRGRSGERRGGGGRRGGDRHGGGAGGAAGAIAADMCAAVWGVHNARHPSYFPQELRHVHETSSRGPNAGVRNGVCCVAGADSLWRLRSRPDDHHVKICVHEFYHAVQVQCAHSRKCGQVVKVVGGCRGGGWGGEGCRRCWRWWRVGVEGGRPESLAR